MKKLKENKAITLVALIVTIIILLILAGISIAQLTGNGLFEKAKLAKEVSKNAQDDEDDKIKQYGNEIDGYWNSGREGIMVDKEEYEELKRDVEILKNSAQTNDYIITRTKTLTFTTNSGVSYTGGTYDIDAVEGYEPIGVVGVNSPILDWIPYSFTIQSGQLRFYIRNYRSANTTNSISVNILYKKI